MKWVIVIIGLLVVLEAPDESGKRKIGKEIHMKHLKNDRKAVISI